MDQDVLIAQNKAYKAENSALKQELEQLKRLIYGHKSERFIPAHPPEQLSLGFEEADEALAEPATEKISYQRKKKSHPGRTALPDNIPVEEVIIEPDEDTSNMKVIGEEVTEAIDYVPGILLKRRYIRKKYAPIQADADAQVLIGELPSRPIPKGIAEAGLLAHLMVGKFVDHLPFYRQIEQFKRNYGWTIHKSTLNDWMAACCTLLEPLYEALIQQVLDSDYLQVDESPIKVLDSDKKGKTHQGYMWVYRNPLNGLVLFDYRKGRGMHGPKERLSGYQGYLQTDGYAVYQKLARKNPKIHQVACLAHIRRKFFDAQTHHPTLAKHGLAQIQRLYALERTYREQGLDPDQIKDLRQEQAKPIMDELTSWVIEQQANNLSKGPIGKALKYALHQLPLLTAYLEDGRIQIDNNLIENAIRPLALGRKNYLFAGSHQGAKRIAMMYSFFASCKTINVNPWIWLKDVLDHIPEYPVNRMTDLLPQRR